MSGNETVSLVEPWLYEVLSGDSTLTGLVGGRIVNTLEALGNVETPFVVFSMASTRDIVGIGGVRIDTESIYIVKAVTAGSSNQEAKPIAARIDQLLHLPNTTITISGGSSLTCMRERTIGAPEEVSGQQYRHLGGYYRIRAI